VEAPPRRSASGKKGKFRRAALDTGSQHKLQTAPLQTAPLQTALLVKNGTGPLLLRMGLLRNRMGSMCEQVDWRCERRCLGRQSVVVAKKRCVASGVQIACSGDSVASRTSAPLAAPLCNAFSEMPGGGEDLYHTL
jgi:hypothetical protein